MTRRSFAEFGEALEQQIPALRRYAFALTRERTEADDLVQDCLERALSRWRLQRSDNDLRPWLFAILRNLFIDRMRAARRRPQTTPITEALETQRSLSQDGIANVHDVLGALDRLPEEQRSLLLLVGVEELTYDEAARALALPVGTVMSRLSRARAALREAIEGRRALLRRVK